MESSCTRFTAAEGGARLAASAGSRNILVTEHAAFISTSVLVEHAYKIRGPRSAGRQRSAFITRASRIECVSHELSILTDLSIVRASTFDDVADWKEQLETKEVLVCTSSVLKTVLERQILSIRDLNVMIIDSCHLIVKDQSLQCIMKLYRQCEENKPRILAITYPLFTAPKDVTEQTDSEVTDSKNENNALVSNDEYIIDNTDIDKEIGKAVKDICSEVGDNKDAITGEDDHLKDTTCEGEINHSKHTEVAIVRVESKDQDITKDNLDNVKDGKIDKDREIDETKIGCYDNLDDFKLYEKLEWKIDELERELCCDMDLAEDIDGGKRLSATLTKPKELIVEYSPRAATEALPEPYVQLEEYMRTTVGDALDFMNEHRYDPTEIYGDDMYEEFVNIPDPTADPKYIFKEFLYVLDELGPYAADKAAFSLLVKLEKLKIKVPYERHFLLLCLCTSVLVKIRYYAEYLFSKCASDWEKIVSFSTPKVLRLGEILELFQPPENVRETNIKNAADEVKVSDCSIVDENDNKNKSTITDNINGDVHILNEKDLHNGMKKSKTNELLKAIEKCDFTTLGNKIEDRVNTYEANLKDLDDFYDLPENNNESSPKLAISVINENKSPKNIINDNTNTEIDSKNDGSSINNSIVNQSSDNIQLNQDSEYNNGDSGNEDIENKDSVNKGSDNKDSDNKGSDNKDSGNKDSVNKGSDNKESGNKDSVNKGSDNKGSGNKDSGIKNSGNKEIDRSTEPGKLGFGKRAGHRLKGRNRVQRSNTMKMQQSQQNPDSLCGIVFVKEVLMAKVLFMIIADMSRSRPSLSYLCAQYCASECGREKDCQREGKKQEEVLKKFRMHECNLLLATSVLEEGIDLPRCNLVVRWDVPLSYRSHGLCRSRARAPRASVALLALAESHAGALVHNLAVYKELDQIITRKCGCGIQFEPPLEEENHADSVAFIVKPYTPDIRNDSTNNTKFKETDSNKRNCEEIEERKMGVELLDHKKKVNIDLYNTKPIAVVDDVISDICYEPEINVDKIDNEEASENKINDLKSEDNDCLIGNEVLGESVTQIQIHPMTADMRLSEQEKNVINATEHKDLSTKDFYPNDITENTEMTYNSEISFKINKDKHCDNLTDEDKINRENNKKCANEMTAEILDQVDRVYFDDALQNSDVNHLFDNGIDKLEANSNISLETIDNNILNHNIDAVKDTNDKNLEVNDSLTDKFGANSVYEDIKYDFKLNDGNKSNGNMATVDLNSAIALINRYCGKLPSDTFTRLAPQWWMEEVRLPDKQGTMTTAYICTLRMPLNCPVKYNIVGHPMPTRVLARRMVALQACRILHKSGELDNQLMPIGKENFKAAELEASATCSEPDSGDCARPGTTKRRQYYFKRTAWAFTDCQAIIDSTDQEIENNPSQDTTKASSHNMLYAIVSRLWCALPERYNTRGRRLHAPQHAAQAIGVLMARREPTQLQIPAFPVYTRSGEVRVSVEPALEADVRLSPRRARLIRRFMRFVFADVLLVRRRGMRLQADGTSYNNYYVVPTVKKIKSDGSYWTDVDWPFLELIYRHTEEQKNLEVDMPVLWEQVDKKKEKEKDGNVKKMENPLLKDGEVFTFDPEKYKEAVVTPWYRNQDQPQFFLVAEICWKLSPDSAFPSAQHDSFRSYYRAKYGAELTQSLQPLLDVDHTSARLNLLTPRYVNRKGVTLPVSSERTRRAKRDRLDQKQILVPELCRVHPFAAPLWFATVALPCVLYRINALLIADEIRRAVAIDVGLGIPRIDDGTCPGFQWPPLDFGWSLAEVLSADTEKTEKTKESDEETKRDEISSELSEQVEKENVEGVEEKLEEKEKTINDILQEKLEAESGFEIGTWSNDMASSIPQYDEFMEPLPPNLTFCTSSSGGANWSQPIEKPKGQFNPTRSYYMADSDCSYISSDFDTDDSDLTDCSDDDTDTSGFCSSRNTNAAMGVRIEYKTAHEAEAVDLERRKPIAPAPQPDKVDDDRDLAEYKRILRGGAPPPKYIEEFKKSVAEHEKDIKKDGNLISKDKPIVNLLPEPSRDLEKYYDHLGHRKKKMTDGNRTELVLDGNKHRKRNDAEDKKDATDHNTLQSIPDERKENIFDTKNTNNDSIICDIDTSEVNDYNVSCKREDSVMKRAADNEVMESLSPSIDNIKDIKMNASATIVNFDSKINTKDIDSNKTIDDERLKNDIMINLSKCITKTDIVNNKDYDTNKIRPQKEEHSESTNNIMENTNIPKATDDGNLENEENKEIKNVSSAVDRDIFDSKSLSADTKFNEIKEEIIIKSLKVDKNELPKTKDPLKTKDATKVIEEIFPYETEIELRGGQITLESIERSKRQLLAELRKSLPDDEIKKMNCFSMVDVDIDSPGYVNEKVANVGFDSKERYQERVKTRFDSTEHRPYYMESKGQNGKEFDFDYQPDLEGHPGPSPSVILQALTMSNANDGINLERLETIGDSFLKFAITAYLYCAHPAVHEGKLSHMRSKQVSNLNLYRLGRNKRLGARMIASKFEPHDNWLPPCHRPPPTLQPGGAGETKEPLKSPDAPVDSAGCFIPYNLITQHSIPDKSIADCVEALIGAYLLECGPRGALLFMSWLGIRVLPRHVLPLPPDHPYVLHGAKDQERVVQRPPLPKPVEPVSSDSSCSDDEQVDPEMGAPEPDWSWPGRPVGTLRPYQDGDGKWMQPIFGELKAPPSPLLRYIEDPEGELEQMLSGYDALEKTLQYRFRDRSLLLQALTHASHQRNRLTDCYQRLEFLGDAILDYLITRHLYEDPRRHSPGALTDLRSALVNNTIFATLAARHGFHKYFRHMSPGLNEVLSKYVKIQEENGHSISEEHYLIQEDEMEQAEDVEVPKALGDLFESVAGAIFLDSGMSLGAVWRSVGALLGAELDAFSAAAPKSPVRELLEAEPDTAKFGKPERLADGRRVRVCVEVFGRGAFKGIGRNYRIAKGTAARCALRHLRSHRPR